MRTLRLTVIFLCLCAASFAQEQKKVNMQMRILEAKYLIMESELELTGQQKEPFKALYFRYEKALTNAASAQENLTKPENELTQDEAVEYVTKRLAVSQRMLNIKKKTLPEFARILSPQQLLKFYRTESEIRVRINREYIRRNNQEPK